MPSVDSLSPRRVQMTERSLSAVVPALLLASAAVAQQNPPTPASDQPAATPAAAVPEEAKPKRAAGEEIVVTGSRIRRKDLTTPAPVTPWLLPLPRPMKLEVHYGEPFRFEGTGSEDDDVIRGHVEKVKSSIAALIEKGRASRRGHRQEAS